MARPHFIPDWKNIYRFLVDKRADWKPKLFLALTAIYLLWPIDLVPDLIPFFGWLDDLGAGAVAIWYLSRTVEKYLEEKTPTDKKR